MSYYIPPEIIDKFNLFEVKIEQTGSEDYEQFSPQVIIDTFTVNLLITTHVCPIEINRVELFRFDDNWRDMYSDRRSEFTNLRETIVENKDEKHTVQLGGCDDCDVVSCVCLKYKTRKLYIKLYVDGDVICKHTFANRDHILKLVDALLEYFDRATKRVEEIKQQLSSVNP